MKKANRGVVCSDGGDAGNCDARDGAEDPPVDQPFKIENAAVRSFFSRRFVCDLNCFVTRRKCPGMIGNLLRIT